MPEGPVNDNTGFSATFFGGAGGKPGLLGRAPGGCLFLDEITALLIAAQATLARILDSGACDLCVGVPWKAQQCCCLRHTVERHHGLQAHDQT